MKQEDKELLLKDLCCRLPYGVKVKTTSRESKNRIVYLTEDNIFHLTNGWWSECKPYLFPISSMTEEQCIKLFEILGMGVNSNYGGDYVKINDVTGITFFFESGRDIETVMKAIDYLNSIHVDYRGLIPKGLAIDATGLNIY